MPAPDSSHDDFRQRVIAMDAILARSTTLDRTLLDTVFAALSGIDISRMEPKLHRKLERILVSFNDVAVQFPDARDPSKPLPGTALVTYAYHMQQIRILAAGLAP
ncbi:MAG TPA: hypothetical protein DCS97_14275 [Planctomycetes bacterium]|nr:hypothetical protein [Planctomycetota bacterium]